MSQKITARFYVAETTRRAYNPDHVAVTLHAVSRGTENASWAAATPAGELKMTVNNPAAAEFFGDRLGKDVILTLEAAPDDEGRHQSPHTPSRTARPQS